MAARLVFFGSRLLAVATMAALPVAVVAAQNGIAREGALYLLLPLGTSIVTSGQSVAMPDASTDQLFWNPSAIARATKSEMAFHYGQFFVGPLGALAYLRPFGRAGVVGISATMLDYGSQDVGDINSITGTASEQSYIAAATYAATFGPRFSAGFTFKNTWLVQNCSGLCPPDANFSVSTSAVDIGLQYRVLHDDDLILAAAVRHLGQKLQINDQPQADPLPSRMQFGASYRLRVFDNDLPGSALRINADIIDRVQDPGSAALRFGAELSWHDLVAVRTGYVGGTGEGTGIAAGLSVTIGQITGDVGITLSSNAGDAARANTYVSLKRRW